MKPLIILVLSLASTSSAFSQALPPELPPAQEVAALRAAESTGREIFLHDRAAAIATDAVRELGAFDGSKQLRGWVTEQVADSIVVTFIGATARPMMPLVARYRVVVSPDGKLAEKPAELKTPRPLTAFESGAAAARELAATSTFPACGERYNSVVLPVPNSVNRFVVYLLPGTEDYRVIPIGGAHRFDVDVSARKVISQRAYSQSCLVIKDDPKAIALMVTHLLDPVPSEVHVFWNLWARRRMIVLTPPHGTSWGLENGEILLMERRKK